MNWRDEPDELDDEGRPRWHRSIMLTNDKREILGHVFQGDEDGNAYAWAMNPRNTRELIRLGSFSSIAGAQSAVDETLTGLRGAP